MGLLQLHTQSNDWKAVKAKPRIFKKNVFSFLVSQRKDSYGRSSRKNRQISNTYHYTLCIRGTLNQVHPIPGSLTLAACYFWDILLTPIPPCTGTSPSPDQDSNSFLQPQYNTLHLVPKITLIAWTRKHEFSIFLMSLCIILKGSCIWVDTILFLF